MGPVRKYRVTVNGAETVLKLNDEDVKAYPDAQPLDGGQADADTTSADTKSRTPANKARSATNKTDGNR